MMLLRHLFAILALPFVAVVIVPRSILLHAAAYDVRWNTGGPWELVFTGAAVAVGSIGLTLCFWCVRLFARVGRGTLAPWDPTRRLVAVGPYRYVRNPMISGVLAILIAETLFFRSLLLGAWAALFWLINHVYFIASEEPGLRRRFGDDYRRYAAEVPRWIPRRPRDAAD